MDYDYWENNVIDEIEDEFIIGDVENYSNESFDRFERMESIGGRLPTAGVSSTPSYNIKEKPGVTKSMCAVCGDGQAKLHYGILACYGCKGFFRRTLTGKYRYICRFGKNCTVDKFHRNSCRYCRFRRCLDVGMDPKAVRPDRDLTGRQRVPRIKKRHINDELLDHMARLHSDDLMRKLPVESRILLMQLMNIESKVVKGDISTGAEAQSSKNISLRKLFEQKPMLDGRRTEMNYEPYRMARIEELRQIAHRRAIAAVDWVHSLAEIADIIDTEDKVALVKSCYSPLTIFNFSARTVQNTKNPDILCLCSFSYVPRKLPPEFNQTNQLSDNLIDRTLNELVAPLRKLLLKEEEIVPLKAIIILNPNAKDLSPSAKQTISQFRDHVQDTLFHVVRELHPANNASSRFGNLLLLLPTIMTLSSIMSENLQFVQAFANRNSSDNLLNELFGDVCVKLDERVTSSSPSNLENPAEISLRSISESKLHGAFQSRSQGHKSDSCTQTDFHHDFIEPTSSNINCDDFTLTSHNDVSSFSTILEMNEFSSVSPYPDIPNDCDLFSLMDIK